MPSKYQKAVGIVAPVNAAEYVSFITDLRATVHNHSYITITIQMQISHCTLCTQEAPLSHTAESLADEISRILDNLGLQGKFYDAMTDNARNILQMPLSILWG